MLKRIFEEGLATQKNRLRELRSYAQGEIFHFQARDLRVPSSADFDFKIYGSLAKHT